MLLRPRQKIFVEKSVAALRKHGNTLGVAPTGAGKTIMLSAVVGGIGEKSCILAHRDELTVQNVDKFSHVNPDMSVSIFDAYQKSFDGQATFAMVQTLCKNLENIPKLGLLVIDEAHHAIAPSYMKVIEAVRAKNPKVKIYGVTATPNRGDKLGLIKVFNNVADKITIKELIESGHLVPPRTFVIDAGTQADLKNVKKTLSDFDMKAVEKIMNKRVVNDLVIENWKDKASDRKTVIFCSTIDHASDVATAFREAGIETAFVHGQLTPDERKAELARFETGAAQVVVNVAVLTEGWDYPPTSCVVLLRPSSYKSTMVQMIGRGLRIADGKSDCIVLDFGTSSLIHGRLEEGVDLIGKEATEHEIHCPACDSIIPTRDECPICGYVFEQKEPDEREASNDLIDGVSLQEIDLMEASHFIWNDIFGDGSAFIASGFSSWAGVFEYRGKWVAVGGSDGTEILYSGDKKLALSQANDFMNALETGASLFKTRKWLNEAPTDKQLRYLPSTMRNDYSLTRYKASTLLTFKFNQAKIERLLRDAL